MPLSYPDILSVSSVPRRVTWTDRDVILYALGVGYGMDPTDEADLPFVYENGLRVAPTFAAALTGDFDLREPMGLDLGLSVHAAHRLVLHRPLPPSGEATVMSRVVQVIDKGAAKGAIIVTETALTEPGQTSPTVSSVLTRFARGDGGCGGPSGGGETPHPMPQRPPDLTIEAQTRPEQALLYRQSGDLNPLHVSPAAARTAGFERPILHGLCSFGIVCRVALRAYGDSDPSRFLSQATRFSAPLYPGETLTVDMWRDFEGKNAIVSFEARVAERAVKIMTNGRLELSGGPR